MSTYLNKTKPVLKELLTKLLAKYEYASIFATDCNGKRYTVNRNGVNLNDNFFKERGVVVRVYADETYTEYAFNNIDKDNLDEIVANIDNTVMTAKKLNDTDSLIKQKLINEEAISFSKTEDIKVDPAEVGPKYILSKLTELKDKALSLNEKIIEFQAIYNYLNVNKLFLSPKKDLEQSFTWSESYLFGVSSDGTNVRQIHKSYSGLKGAELIDEMFTDVPNVVDTAVALLNAEKIAPGEYDVICSPDITGLIAHEAFGHGVEMDMAVKDRAKSPEFIGKYVASPIVNMVDSAIDCVTHDDGSYYFDDEGNLATVTTIIENGILKSGINDELTAIAFNTKTTGNGRREAYDHKAYTRMTNTYIKPGADKLEDMFASIKDGVYLESYSSGMEDPKNWGIQCMICVGREIKDGKLTDKIYSPILMTGYVPDLLKSISMIADDFDTSGSGACGKGYKELVKVSSGGPHIKCKARLG